MSFTDRDRAGSFGEDAARYDRARPSYPPALIDDLVAGSRTAVDVGCGTGIVARLLTARGVDVVGVEADERMAGVARSRGVAVEVARFEEWDAGGRRFDLLTSGQAWHWVEPDAGAAKAAEVLRPGGQLAVFWNGLTLPEEVLRAIAPVYRRLAPDQLADSVALGTAKAGGDQDGLAFERSGYFVDVEHRTYEWEQTTTFAEFVDVLPTHSRHRLLGDEVLDQLLPAVAAALAPLGREMNVRYSTGGIFARRGER